MAVARSADAGLEGIYTWLRCFGGKVVVLALCFGVQIWGDCHASVGFQINRIRRWAARSRKVLYISQIKDAGTCS
jgi:hypothetical protein